jgi:hypothetical protein
MVIFNYALLSIEVNANLQIPLLLQFIILFIYTNRNLSLHMRIKGMDMFTNIGDQVNWFAST